MLKIPWNKRQQPTAAQDTLPKVLRFFDRFERPLTAHGVNYRQLRLIMATKFTVTNRDRSTNAARRGQKNPGQHPLRAAFIINLIVGLFFAVLLYSPVPMLLSTVAFMTTLFVLIFLMMLTNYSGIMLDPRDRTLFAARGVDLKTISVARILVVGYYLTMNVVALGIPAAVAVFIKAGPLVCIGLMVGTVGLGLFALLLALFVYLLVLRFFDGERLKNVLNFVQIAMVIGIYALGQIVPRLDATTYAGFAHVNDWVYALIVPAWFAGPTILLSGHELPVAGVLTLLAVVSTSALFVVYRSKAADFERYLAKLETASDQPRKDGWYMRLTGSLFTRSREERSYFEFSWKVLRDQRDFKLRVYPMFAYMIIIVVAMFMGFGQNPNVNWLSVLRRGVGYGPLVLNVAMGTAVFNLAFSDQPQAMRLFQRVPLRHDGLLLLATLKVLCARMFLPFMLLFCVVAALLGGLLGLVTGVATSIMSYAILLVIGRTMSGKVLPFAREFDARNQTGGMAAGFLGVGLMIVDAIVVVVGVILNGWVAPLVVGVLGVIAAVSMAASVKLGVHFDVRAVDNSDH